MIASSHRAWLPASFTAAWDRASPRERRIAGIGALIVVLAAGWAWVWQPMNMDIERTRAELARAKAALANARALVDESAALARDTRSKEASDPRAAIARVLAERDLKISGRLDVQEGRVKVVLPEARFDRLLGALDALRRDEGLRVVEAVVAARVEPGTVRAELTLAR